MPVSYTHLDVYKRQSQGYISIGSGKVNKHLFADKLQIPEEDIEQAIQYVAAQENR